MDKELIINSSPTNVEIALIENAKLAEIHREKTNTVFAVGDIFLGTIRKLMPGLNAAFVDLGHRKDAFLHYTDLGPQIKTLIKYTNQVKNKNLTASHLEDFTMEPDNPKTGKIDQVFNRNQFVLVQVLKEPISTKGPRLSCEITIPGRYIVLTPFSDVVAVSKKIQSSEERNRLKVLIESVKPRKFGVIVRTAAEGKKVADLHNEIRELLEKWDIIFSTLQDARKPQKLLSELDKTTSILRDVLNDSFNKVVVNDKRIYKNLRNYMSGIAPEKVKIINHHSSSRPIFDDYGITKQIKASFGKTSTLASGAYIIIESTEAMHVIDVNSGPKMQKKSQEDAALTVNIESAEEIARQLRLRDIGGLIIIDFIDMKKSDNRTALFKAMREFMSNDRAQHTILPLSKFGLMQITRQRVRPAVIIDTTERCPACKGTGKVTPSILLTDDIERDLRYILQTRSRSKITLTVHPFVYSYLKKGFPNTIMKWYFKYNTWVRLKEDTGYHLYQYNFHDNLNGEIRLN